MTTPSSGGVDENLSLWPSVGRTCLLGPMERYIRERNRKEIGGLKMPAAAPAWNSEDANGKMHFVSIDALQKDVLTPKVPTPACAGAGPWRRW